MSLKTEQTIANVVILAVVVILTILLVVFLP